MEQLNDKYINLDVVYELLNDMCNNVKLSIYQRIELKRFIQKLSESSSFLNIINQAFSNQERKLFSDNIKKAFTGKVRLTRNSFIEYNTKKKNWELYFNDDKGNKEIFLDDLNWTLVKNIMIDLNVAFLIKAKRNETKKL